MSTSTVQEREAPAPGGGGRARDVFQRLADLASRCRTATAFYREAMNAIADHFGVLFAAMNVSNAAESLDEQLTTDDSSQATWQRLTQASVLESEADGVALARLYDIDGTTSRVAICTVPLRDEQQNTGAMAIVAHCPDRAAAELLLFQLKSLVTLASSLVATVHRAQSEAVGAGDAVQRAVAKAARFGSLTELAFAITNGLKTKFNCDQVVLGKVGKGRVRLLSLSSMDALYPRSPGTRLIRQAMEECLDSGHAICSRPSGDWSDNTARQEYRLHRQWRSAIGDAAVASVPLFADGRCVAVISLVRPGNVGFQSGELDEINQLAGAYGPAIQLVARASRSWLVQTRDTLRDGLLWLVARNHWGRKFVAATAVLVATWFFAGTMNYRLSMPCQIIPTRVHHFAAPFEGVIHSAYVDVGDHVKAGQLLFVMDTRDLELLRRKYHAEAAVLELEIAQSVARQKWEQAALAQARRQVTRAKLDSVGRRMSLAKVTALVDGTIMAGDVESRVGDVVPIGEPLLEFAPHGSWAVELRVDSHDAPMVQSGQQGQFVTIARPDQSIACVVERIEPAATVVNGDNVFLARAKVTGDAAWSLAGMDGVATMEVGRRRVWWVALHRVIDFVRLHFWI